MKNRIKVPYVTPYDERSGIRGHVWAELGGDHYLYITPKQNKRAEDNLTVGGVSPAYVLDDVPDDVRGLLVAKVEERDLPGWHGDEALTIGRMGPYGYPRW